MTTLIVVQDIVWDGAVARGGHTMFVLQWLVGLERTGRRVVFVDVVDDPAKVGESSLRAFGDVIEKWWRPEQTALIVKPSLDSLYGLDRAQLDRAAQQADALITIGIPGTREPIEPLRKIRPRILVEQDPGYTHLWALSCDPRDLFGEQDCYFTVGGNVGAERCSLPTAGIRWRSTWNPVVMDWWPEAEDARDCFTTIAGWWGQGYLEFSGRILGPKAEEFRKFLDLPQRVGESLEIVLEINPDDPDIALLRQCGWQLRSPASVARPEAYRDYVRTSFGEFSCAKGGYVGTRCGWFSDRSACYLASGRPVILQATGFEDLLPTGRGLFAVSTVEEAVEAMQAVRRDYRLHSAAAKAIAREHFAADRVVARLLAEAGVD
jgi:hypothetical protein